MNKKLTPHQMDFIVDNFFESKQHAGSREIAIRLIDQGKCIVAGDKCIWQGGVGNFIKTNPEPRAFGCCEYSFDLEKFLESAFFTEFHNVRLINLEKELKTLEKKLEELRDL
jgi:hypothetical protein